MTTRDSVPTESGRLTVQSGELRVRKTPRGIVRGQYFDNWKGKNRLRKGWFIFSNIFATITLGRIVNEWLGFSGGLLSVGFVLSALSVHVGLWLLKLANGRLREGVSIPLRTIHKVEHDKRELEIVHGEFEDVETTEIEFPRDSDAEKAIELLRWKSIRIAELGKGKNNLRTEIDRELERETA
ncbi:hypothetical protein SAMN05421858_0811 [Haladaptatus litoreus]|uniref:Uncharacterized protein n=1 Tax=Haladaptatus litoreus TaxID=553468 RepID=A0A1N6WP26_9EURY|nr:hypothetical protein [Haladaptatus litoreus]SIQ91795.1 hypothetical protein SAMN05421858_0811 [Haladaptatus litoreus]